MIEVGQRIRELREGRSLTQEDVAAALDIDKSAVSRIEKGTRGLAAAELAAVCEVLGVSADHVLFGEVADEVLLRADGEADAAVDFAKSVLQDLEFVEALLG